MNKIRILLLRRGFVGLFALLMALLGVGCGLTGCDDEEDLYAHERAFFRFTPVTGVAPLLTALNNPGRFCRITIGTSTFDFLDAEGRSQSYPQTALIAYGKPECIGGFVVGTASLPDLDMQYRPVAYELACPNCYEDNMLQIATSFKGLEALRCHRCHRVYDLANGGIVTEDKDDPTAPTTGRRLYRYRMTYQNDLLLIMN